MGGRVKPGQGAVFADPAPADPAGLPPLREVIRHGIAARKSLGQNFILDLNLTGRMRRAPPGRLDHASGDRDRRRPGGADPRSSPKERAGSSRSSAIPAALPRSGRLAAALYPGRLELVAGDALALDPVTLCEEPRKIVANLPYNIATALLLRWLDRIADYESLTLMFQREVALRLVAAPRSPAYGRLSVLVQWLTLPKILFDLPPRAFVPPPKVTSSVVGLTPRADLWHQASTNPSRSGSTAAFGQRRRCCAQPQRTAQDPGSSSSPRPASPRPPAPRNSQSPNSARFAGINREPLKHSEPQRRLRACGGYRRVRILPCEDSFPMNCNGRMRKACRAPLSGLAAFINSIPARSSCRICCLTSERFL